MFKADSLMAFQPDDEMCDFFLPFSKYATLPFMLTLFSTKNHCNQLCANLQLVYGTLNSCGRVASFVEDQDSVPPGSANVWISRAGKVKPRESEITSWEEHHDTLTRWQHKVVHHINCHIWPFGTLCSSNSGFIFAGSNFLHVVDLSVHGICRFSYILERSVS